MKSVLAVGAGFLVIAVLSLGADAMLRAAVPQAFGPNGGATSAPILIAVLVYSALFETMWSYLTARLAPQKPKSMHLYLAESA